MSHLVPLPPVRQALFLNTRQAVDRILRRAVQPTGTSGPATDTMQFVLTDDDLDAVALVYAIEDCLFHGLKVRAPPPPAPLLSCR